MKKIRRLKILLTEREILIKGFAKQPATDENNSPVCPVCHSPLSGDKAKNTFTGTEIKKFNDGEK